MSHEALPPLPAECDELRDQLEEWRRTRKKRSRVPESVWKSAERLAEKFGTHRIAQELRLNYMTLKKRVSGSAPKGVPKKKTDPVFVEMDSCRSASSGECVVELANCSGTRMRIELKIRRVRDLLELIQPFCSQAV